MPDNITYMTIPVGIRTGGVFMEIDNTQAVKGLPQMNNKLLLLGQRLPTGNTPALTPFRLTSAAQASAAAGRGSMLHRMMALVEKAIQRYGPLDVYAVALDDLPAGVAATGTFTTTGSATQPGVLYAYIGGHRISCGVSYADTAATVAANLATAINAEGGLPVTASAAAGVVTVTAKNKGSVANGLELATTYYDDDSVPAGLTVACASLSGGVGDPDVGAALAVITEDWYYSIGCPYTDPANLATLEADMANRWGGMNMRTGHVFNATNGTQGTLCAWGQNRNSPHGTTWGLKGCPTWTAARAASLAAVCTISGTTDPAMPLRNLELPGVMAPRLRDRFMRTERELLLRAGISTTTVTQGGNVILERVITNYQTNPQGVPDESLLRLETKWTVDYYRYAVRTRIALRFPNHKLADDGINVAPGQRIVTPKVIRGELVALHSQLEQAGIVEDTEGFKKALIVTRSMADVDRVNAILTPNLVNQFVTFAASVQYIL